MLDIVSRHLMWLRSKSRISSEHTASNPLVAMIVDLVDLIKQYEARIVKLEREVTKLKRG